MPSGRSQIAEVTLLLSANCNLRCSYCYQDARQPGVMSWPVLRAALDLLLASGRHPRAVTFAGGEPTLAWPLVRKAVAYLDAHNSKRRPVLHLITNGLLLGARELAFLASHGFALDLSFDGIAAAQDLRAEGSFTRADAVLERLHANHPEVPRPPRGRVRHDCSREHSVLG